MELACLDLEGVLIPEIWIEFSKRTSIPELSRTTRDEPDYDKLMRWRIDLLRQHGLKLADIQSVIAGMEPLAGARDFLDALRARRVEHLVEHHAVDAHHRVVLRDDLLGRHVEHDRAQVDSYHLLDAGEDELGPFSGRLPGVEHPTAPTGEGRDGRLARHAVATLGLEGADKLVADLDALVSAAAKLPRIAIAAPGAQRNSRGAGRPGMAMMTA